MFRKASYKIIDLIYYIRFFGKSKGFQVWWKINFSLHNEIKISIPFFLNPVYLRKRDSDISIFNQVFAERQYKWINSETLQPRVIVDAGANVGFAALYFAEKYPEAKIFCIEPDPSNYNQLKKNTLNYQQIKTLNAALWYTNEPLELTYPSSGSASISVKSAGGVYAIDGRNMNSVLEHFNIEHIDILKMDVEGAEKEIFSQGSIEWLKKVDILVIELHDMYRDGTANAFFAALNNKFSKMYFQGENIVCFLQHK